MRPRAPLPAGGRHGSAARLDTGQSEPDGARPRSPQAQQGDWQGGPDVRGQERQRRAFAGPAARDEGVRPPVRSKENVAGQTGRMPARRHMDRGYRRQCWHRLRDAASSPWNRAWGALPPPAARTGSRRPRRARCRARRLCRASSTGEALRLFHHVAPHAEPPSCSLYSSAIGSRSPARRRTCRASDGYSTPSLAVPTTRHLRG